MQKTIPIQLTRRKIQFPFEIAIPCFQTPEVVLTKTLMLCRAYGFPNSKLTLFVETKEREQQFKSELPRKAYGRIVVANPSVAATYTYIVQFYPPGTKVVCIYEDCLGFLEYNKESPTRGAPLRSLLNVLRNGFDACINAKTILWGMYPIADPQYFKTQPIQTQLCYTSPAIWGIQIPFRPLPFITSSSLHHYERILGLYTEYKSIVRLNHVACCYTPHTLDSISKQEVESLLEKYPDYISLEEGQNKQIHLRVHDSSKD
jgi:hypothetical protein